MSQKERFLSVLLKGWWWKTAGIDMERNYVTVMLCIRQYYMHVASALSSRAYVDAEGRRL